MRVLLFSVCIVGLASFMDEAVAQTPGEQYYVTIGVFARENNAIHLTALANKVGFIPQYGINPLRKLYYVYVFKSGDKKEAFAFLIKLKVDTKFKDAWVFTGSLGNDQAAMVVKETVRPVNNPPVNNPPVNNPPANNPPVIEEVKPIDVPAKVDSSKIAKVRKKAKGKFFEFQFINKETGNEVRGEIHLAESKVATQYQAFKANEMVDVPAPRNGAGTYFVTTIAPGFRPIETNISYKDPLPSSSGTGPDGELIIPLTLETAKRGDYIEFNDVSFYKNSSIMNPKSEDELSGLADLMKTNMNYKVRVHAHCNGDNSRDIIGLGTSNKFFENDPGNEKKSGSAKELTELRAESVRRYLVSQGINVDRIMTKGEGGKMMIYPQTSVYANFNDRVEIEVVRH